MSRRFQAYPKPSRTTEGFALAACAALVFLCVLIGLWPTP